MILKVLSSNVSWLSKFGKYQFVRYLIPKKNKKKNIFAPGTTTGWDIPKMLKHILSSRMNLHAKFDKPRLIRCMVSRKNGENCMWIWEQCEKHFGYGKGFVHICAQLFILYYAVNILRHLYEDAGKKRSELWRTKDCDSYHNSFTQH